MNSLSLNRFKLLDGLSFFTDEKHEQELKVEIDKRILNKDYIPSDEDVLKVRIKTSGMTRKSFEIDNHLFDITGTIFFVIFLFF